MYFRFGKIAIDDVEKNITDQLLLVMETESGCGVAWWSELPLCFTSFIIHQSDIVFMLYVVILGRGNILSPIKQ